MRRSKHKNQKPKHSRVINYKDIIAKHATHAQITDAFASKFRIFERSAATAAAAAAFRFTNNNTNNTTLWYVCQTNPKYRLVQLAFDCFRHVCVYFIPTSCGTPPTPLSHHLPLLPFQFFILNGVWWGIFGCALIYLKSYYTAVGVVSSAKVE